MCIYMITNDNFKHLKAGGAQKVHCFSCVSASTCGVEVGKMIWQEQQKAPKASRAAQDATSKK